MPRDQDKENIHEIIKGLEDLIKKSDSLAVQMERHHLQSNANELYIMITVAENAIAALREILNAYVYTGYMQYYEQLMKLRSQYVFLLDGFRQYIRTRY